jgi:hypothetical protein
MKKLPIIWGIILLFLMTSIYPVAISEINDFNDIDVSSNPYLLSYHSYIDLSYEISDLLEPLNQMYVWTIPITVDFWTDIPDFFRILPYRFANLFLYKQFYSPMVQINLEVLNAPEWAQIYINSPNLIIDIPFYGDGKYYLATSLVFLIYENAPSTSHYIDIRATSEGFGRLNGFSHQESIFFSTQFYPNLYIDFKQIIKATPNESIYIPINVTNKGNSISGVRFELLDDLDNWSPILNPSYLAINVDDTAIFQLSLLTPSDFFGSKEFNIRFTSEKYPFSLHYFSETYDLPIVLYYYE